MGERRGLPVHRHSHNRRSSVYAFPSEIDAWRLSRKVVREPEEPLPLWKTLLAPPRALTFGVTMALCLVMVGNGLRPQRVEAQAGGVSAHKVWDTGTERFCVARWPVPLLYRLGQRRPRHS